MGTVQPVVQSWRLHQPWLKTRVEKEARLQSDYIQLMTVYNRMYCSEVGLVEKLLNVDNDWDGEVDCPEVMGPHCLISEEEVAAAIKGLKIGKAAGPTGVVSELMKAAGGFGSRWMTDLINNIVKEGCIPDYWRKSILVLVYKGKGDPLVCGSYRAIKLLEQPMKVVDRVLEKRIRCLVSIDNMQFGFMLVAEWLRVRLRVRMVKGSTLTVGNFLSLENLNVIIRAIN